MSENNITVNDKKKDKSNFHRTKRSFKIGNIDFDKILISKKELYGKKKTRLNTFWRLKIMITLVLYV